MNKISEQAEFCLALMKRLETAVEMHEKVRKDNQLKCHSGLAGYYLANDSGASKTQIQTSIVQLRRELNLLSKMFEDGV